jgi:hypothetical protein
VLYIAHCSLLLIIQCVILDTVHLYWSYSAAHCPLITSIDQWASLHSIHLYWSYSAIHCSLSASIHHTVRIIAHCSLLLIIQRCTLRTDHFYWSRSAYYCTLFTSTDHTVLHIAYWSLLLITECALLHTVHFYWSYSAVHCSLSASIHHTVRIIAHCSLLLIILCCTLRTDHFYWSRSAHYCTLFTSTDHFYWSQSAYYCALFTSTDLKLKLFQLCPRSALNWTEKQIYAPNIFIRFTNNSLKNYTCIKFKIFPWLIWQGLHLHTKHFFPAYKSTYKNLFLTKLWISQYLFPAPLALMKLTASSIPS